MVLEPVLCNLQSLYLLFMCFYGPGCGLFGECSVWAEEKCVFLLLYKQVARVCVVSCVQLLATAWTGVLPAPPQMFPGRNIVVGCRFPPGHLSQESNPRLSHLLNWQSGSLPPGHLGSLEVVHRYQWHPVVWCYFWD